MTAQSPAATIRAAITLLRDTAAAATPGPWHASFQGEGERRTWYVGSQPCGLVSTGVHEDGDAFLAIERDHRDAAYIVLMNPLVGVALADWLEAELAAHEQAGALAAAAASGELHIGGDLARIEVGLSTLDQALAVALAVTSQDRNRTGTATPTDTEPKD